VAEGPINGHCRLVGDLIFLASSLGTPTALEEQQKEHQVGEVGQGGGGGPGDDW
jgi:hypothetical protein